MEKGELVDILYVEDDADIRKTTEMALTMQGRFQVVSCGSGEEALEIAKSASVQMVLLDVMMPGLNGIELFKRLRKLENYKKTPIAFITAKVQPSEIDAYMQMGAIGIIAKPYEPIALPATLNKLWTKDASV